MPEPLRFDGSKILWTFTTVSSSGASLQTRTLEYYPHQLEAVIDHFERWVAADGGDSLRSSDRALQELRKQAEELLQAIDSGTSPPSIEKHGEQLDPLIDLIKEFELRYAGQYRRRRELAG